MVLPFQQHQKIRLQNQQKNQNQSLQSNSLSVLRGVPFWIWDKQQHLQLAKETNQQCCFQHIVGCPTKGGREYPLFDYEKIIYDALMDRSVADTTVNTYSAATHAGNASVARMDFNDTLMIGSGNFPEAFKDKHLYVLKSTGLGVSEFFLRLMGWLCTKDDTYKNSQMVIVTGPNLDLAIKLVRRLKGIFYPKLNITFDDKETVLNLNGCEISAYPSNHIDSFRSLTNPAFILLDESDMFRKSEQEDVRHVSERYIGKSDPYIVLVSTPNMPGSLMENIKKEPEDTCIYKRLFMDYHYGLNRIYTREEIAKAKMSPSFDREYCLKFAGKIGNLLSQTVIDRAILLGEQFSTERIPINPYAIHSLGIDPAWGSSAFGLVLTEHLQEYDIIRVLYADQFDNHPAIQDMIDRIFEFHKQYWNLWIPVDAQNRGTITSLKIVFGENIHYEKAEDVSPSSNKILPVNFRTENKTMVSHLANLFNTHKVAIDPQFDKLVISLRTAIVNEYSYDKEQSSFTDLFDSLRLSLRMYKIQ